MIEELDKLFEDLAPEAKKRAAVIIGRFNPPTAGHYAIFNEVKKFIRTNGNLHLYPLPIVVVIGSDKPADDTNRDPLTVPDRISFMKASGNANGVIFLSASNAFSALSEVRDNGLEPIAIAIAGGAERVKHYIDILNTYFTKLNGDKIKHYKIELKRDNDSDIKSLDANLKDISNNDGSISRISGSLARRAVELGYKKEFTDIVGLQNKPRLANLMFKKIKHAMENK